MGVESVAPGVVRQGIAEHQPGAYRQLPQNGAQRPLRVLPGRLPGFHVGVDASVVALRAAVQEIAKREQNGGLARLTRRVQNEIPLGADQ